MQMRRKLKGGVIEISALLQALIPNLCSLGVLELRQGSVAVPPKLLPIGKQLVVFRIEYF